MNKILQYLRSNIVGISTVLMLIILFFIAPSFSSGDKSFAIIDLTIIAAVGLTYLIYKIINFRKNNPNFKATESTTLVNVLGSVLAILIGLTFGFILMLFVNPAQATNGFFIILRGGFKNLRSIGDMLYYAAPIILTGLSVAFAFRTGLFNIGASGQLTMGALLAVYIGVNWGFLGDISPWLHWGVAVLGALIAGGIWGAIPGVLKAYRNVNEVVSSIMLNYIAMYLVSTVVIRLKMYRLQYDPLTQTYKANTAFAEYIKSTAANPVLNLDKIFLGSGVSATIVVALVVAIILYIILNKTTFGYELKAVGFNRDASRYAGMNAKRNIVYSMIISGMVSGLAGAMIFLDVGKALPTDATIIPEGFTGIAISLLGLSNPFGVFLAGTFYGSMLQSQALLDQIGYNTKIIDIILAVIIYASALALFLQKFVIRALKSKEMKIERNPELVDSNGGDE